MKKCFYGIMTIALLSISCADNSSSSNKAVFITKLGNDTLAVESFEKTENAIIAKVILRSPATTLTSYTLSLDEQGGIEDMVVFRHSFDEGFEGDGEIIQKVQKTGDSLNIELVTNGGPRSFTIDGESGVLPFIDMVHWPFELAFNHSKETNIDTVYQKLLSGTRISDFIVAKIDLDSMTIRHPSRGVMGSRVSESGNIEFLDAGLTTRKLKVFREPYNSVDINALGNQFSSKDKAGSPFGELSSAEEATFYIGEAQFTVEYGSPKRRGRALFGGIVPWGERWRTGANRATHFYTSKDLKIGDLTVPAGEYTLFTIPEPDGGTLIINKQTGQNGQTYNESRDLGRVPMKISNKSESTEAFTISVEEEGSEGVLKLIWGNKVFSINFEIQ